MQLELTPGEATYLAMAIAAFTVFAITLAWCRFDYMRSLRRRADVSRHYADALPQAAE